MANKRISELSSRTPSATDLMVVGDPTTGYSYKCLVSEVGGVTSVFGRTGAVTAAEGDYSLTLLSDVTITSPVSGDILSYNGSSWVNSAGGFVPYTGATQNVTLGEYGMLAGWYRLDLTPTGTPTDQGTMYWDDNQKTLALIMNGTTQKVGHDQFYYAKNSTGSTIAKGTAVRFAGTDGTSGHLLIAPFLADGSNPSSYFMGVTSEEITNGSFGKVQSFGRLDGIDTSAFADGDILYASTTVAGGFQTAVPVAPNNIVQVAAVVAAANNGKLLVRPTLGSKLTSDESVKLTSVANGQVLQYNSTLSVWENVNASALSVNNIYTANGTLTGNRTVTMGGNWLNFSGGNVGLGVTPVTRLDAGTFSTNNSIIKSGSLEFSSFALNNSFFGDNIYYNGSTFTRRSTGRGGLIYFYYGSGFPTDNMEIQARIYNNNSGSTGINSSICQMKINANGSFAIGPSLVTDTDRFVGATFYVTSGGNVLINTTTDAGFRLDVNGTMRVQGVATFTESQIFTSATGVRIVNTTNTNQPVIIGNSNSNNANVGNLTTLIGTTNTVTASTVQGTMVGNANSISTSTIAATVIGTNNSITAATTLEGQFVIGRFSNAGHTASSVIGTYMYTTASNQLIFGLDRSNYSDNQVGYNDIYFGTGPRGVVRVGSTGRGSDVTINGSGGGAVTDAAGGFLRLAAGKSVGAGLPPDIIFATATAATSGTTLQTLTNRWWVKGNTGQLANVASPDASAVLQINSTTQGFLLPRMTTTQRNAISSPATGLMVYDTTTNSLDVYNGTAWLDILAADFITIDNTNNRLGINTASPTYDLHVTGTGRITGNVELSVDSGAYTIIGATGDTSYRLSVDGDLRVYGNIRTAQPTGGTATGVWRLGSAANGTFILNTGTCVEIEIGGTLYKLATVT